MNAFTFSPRDIASAEAARYVLGLFAKESASATAIAIEVTDKLDASLDVLSQAHPDLAADLQALADLARYVGHAEATKQYIDLQRSEFRAALPYGIRKEL